MLLLDSNVIWRWVAERDQLPPNVLSALQEPGAQLFVSVASIWELEIKQAIGKLDLTPEFWPVLRDRAAVSFIDLGAEDAIAAARLPQHHRDPFDRMIIAQAMRRDLTIATSDRIFATYDVRVLSA